MTHLENGSVDRISQNGISDDIEKGIEKSRSRSNSAKPQNNKSEKTKNGTAETINMTVIKETSVPTVKVNGTKETPIHSDKKPNGAIAKSNDSNMIITSQKLPNGLDSTASGKRAVEAPLLFSSKPAQNEEAYKANVRLLLQKPMEESASASAPVTRPTSAILNDYYSMGTYSSRPSSSRSFQNRSRPGSSLNPRLAPQSKLGGTPGKLGPGMAGPYLTDSGRSILSRPTTSKFRSSDLSELFDKIASVADQEPSVPSASAKTSSASAKTSSASASNAAKKEPDKATKKTSDQKETTKEQKDSKSKVKSRRKSLKSGKDLRKKSSVDHNDIEEIKLMKTAADAFKNYKFRKHKNGQKSVPIKKKKFESVVEKVLRERQEQEFKNRHRRHSRSSSGSRKNSNGSATSLLSNSSTKSTSSLNSSEKSEASIQSKSSTANKRPESVAQRIIRQRQEKNITAKVPVTPAEKVKAAQSQNSAKQKKVENPLPLHLALRQSTAHHSSHSKAQIREKIKQQAHLSVVKNYAPPQVDQIYNNINNNNNNKNNNKQSEKPVSAPKKSILKKPSTDLTNPKKKTGRPNLAFDIGEEKDVKFHKIEAEVYVH